MEIVYVLINESMPGYVKIGRTTDLEQRIRSLDTTSVPLPFECFYACTVKDAIFVEKQLHDAFLDSRVRTTREFFEVSPDRVRSALKLAEISDITPKKDFVETVEDQRVLDETRKKKTVFRFHDVDIPVGAELMFSRDENIRARVVNDRQVEYNGEVTYLAPLTQKLLGYSRLVQGALYWLYDGERLDERRVRLEAIQDEE